MKAAIYSRFSTDRQTDSSIADQMRVSSEYAQRQGWSISQTFEDQGISGAAIGNRPGFLAMMRAAQARHFEALIVMDLSRLSRSNADLAKTIDRLAFTQIRVIGVHDGFDSTREGSELISGFSGIMGQAFRKMIAKKTFAALESRAKTQRPTGGRAYGYRAGKVDRGEAFIVNEIFGRFAGGESILAISQDLNGRRIPSPGSSWKRETRRANGWMASGIRVIVRNERYRGVIHWNASEWRKDPDTGKRSRVERPRSEWITHHDQSLRIVSDDLFERAQRRMRQPGRETQPLRGSRYPRKFLLSGLLRCDTCGAHYVMANGKEYGCSSHRMGGACSNGVRVSRTHTEDVLIGRLRTDLLAPESIKVIAADMQAYYAEQFRTQQVKAVQAPRELQEITARIGRLRERLKKGDPDMAADEIQAAIDRAEAKRLELLDHEPAAKHAAKLLKMLPRAAEEARREIALALGGDSRASLKARVTLRDAYEGGIRLVHDEAGGLVAHWNLQMAALVSRVVPIGSGGAIR